MERVVGGILGLAAFAAVTVAGLTRGLAFADCAWRALAAMLLGYLAGRWLVGPAGRVVTREAAGGPPCAGPPARPEPPPLGRGEGPPAGQGPPPGGGAEPPQAA